MCCVGFCVSCSGFAVDGRAGGGGSCISCSGFAVDGRSGGNADAGISDDCGVSNGGGGRGGGVFYVAVANSPDGFVVNC